ncbi:MAG: helix-turn-helix domain-containing protein [Bacteroidetes bacterium]|jgi:transcriptional regulator with XRE-family HTH domain|nr:helix-turn-helix domain-containing protein [Bacteroidota bacterium]
MSSKTQNERIVFGLKVKQLRKKKQLSFSDLSKRAHMSVSYLNEIEKGKKYPKPDKIEALAEALEVAPEELTSTELSPNMAPVGELLQSNFLNELPLDLFGIELAKVAEIIANAPTRVGAFISTLLELSRNYALREENFYFGALRAYLELHNNYFEELEESALDFIRQNGIADSRPIPVAKLRRILEDQFEYEIVDKGLDPYPELHKLRSLFIPKGKKLLLNSKLSPMQQAFQFGKEIGFETLQLAERANTSSLLRGRVFEEVINHSKAIYFSVALHLPLQSIIDDMKQFFARKTWDGEAFLSIMKRYEASPEMYYHRLTNILPRYFGMGKIFFLRFLHDPQRDIFEVDKELHLNRRHHPHGNGLFEHYCRRWVALSLLKDLHEMQQEGKYVDNIVRAQRSHYFGTEDEYLCLTIARPGYPTPNRNVSVTIGILITPDTQQRIGFLEDPAIQHRVVNKTCERCALRDCEVRAAEPVIVDRREEWKRIQARLVELENE